jgi:hypothetical protein
MHFVGTGNNLSLSLRVQICTNMGFMFLIKTLSLVTRLIACILKLFLISNVRCVVNFVFFLLDVYPVSEFRRQVIIQEKEYKISVKIQIFRIRHTL